jgi:hypothetical protein
MWNPFKMLRTRIGKSSRLYIFGLVIQDHIESIGKPILLKGDVVLLNGLFAQVPSDSVPKASTTFSIQICPKPTFQLGPTEISYPEPPSSSGLSHCQNPNKSDPPIWISVPPRWPCQLSVIVCTYFGLTEFCKSVSPRWLANSLLPYCFTSVQPS